MRLFHSVQISLILLGTATPGVAITDPLINGNFENGMTGWTVSVQGGALFNWPGPSAFVDGDRMSVPEIRKWVEWGIRNTTREPKEGATSLSLSPSQSPQPLNVTLPNGEGGLWFPKYYTVTLSQTIHLDEEATISGWSRFWTSDLPGFGDYASVTINGQETWKKDIANYYSNQRDWERWACTVPAGSVTICLNVYGDDLLGSGGIFDAVQVIAVPERLNTLFCLGFSLLAVLGVSLRRFEFGGK